jgi:hypothetical protein
MEWVERVENLDMRVFRAQGIVSVDGIIPMSTASFQPAACLPITPDGFPLSTTSSYQ